MYKKKPIPRYIAAIEELAGGYCAVVTRDGEQVYKGTARANRKGARKDAALFVVQAPEQERILEWDDPLSDEPEEEQAVQQEERVRGVDLDWTRSWVRSHPRFEDEERRVIFAALDSFEALKQRTEVSREELETIVAAICCPWKAAWDVRGDLLAELAWKHPAAQEAFRELMASRKANERFRAIWSLSARMPKVLLRELLGQGLTDRSKMVRLWTATVCDRLEEREMVPEMLRQAEVELVADVKYSLEYHAAMLRDGYLVERKEDGGLTLHIRLQDGWTFQKISQKDVDRGRVPAIVAKRRAERD